MGGCTASVKTDVKASVERENEVDFEAPDESREPKKAKGSPAPAGSVDSRVEKSGLVEDDDVQEAYALNGARQDLRLADEHAKATCECLAVAVGQPGDKAFSWQTVVPNVDSSKQLAVALSSDGIACAGEKEGSLGATYQGYDRAGDDIVILVERARSGRPVVTGAIIPKPRGSGRVWVRPVGRRNPYGRPLDRSQRYCPVTGLPK